MMHTDLVCISRIFEIYTQKLTKKVGDPPGAPKLLQKGVKQQDREKYFNIRRVYWKKITFRKFTIF